MSYPLPEVSSLVRSKNCIDLSKYLPIRHVPTTLLSATPRSTSTFLSVLVPYGSRRYVLYIATPNAADAQYRAPNRSRCCKFPNIFIFCASMIPSFFYPLPLWPSRLFPGSRHILPLPRLVPLFIPYEGDCGYELTLSLGISKCWLLWP